MRSDDAMRDASGALAERPGLFDARAWLVFDAVSSELWRGGSRLCMSIPWQVAGLPVLFALAFAAAACTHAWASRGDSMGTRRGLSPLRPPRQEIAILFMVKHGMWWSGFAHTVAVARLWAHQAAGALALPVRWQSGAVCSWRAHLVLRMFLNTFRWTGVRAGAVVSARMPILARAAYAPAVPRMFARWSGRVRRRSLPAFMWRLLRTGSAMPPVRVFGQMPGASQRPLPVLQGQGVFVLLGPGFAARVLAPNADGTYQVTAFEQGLRALAVRGMAVKAGVPIVEHARLATRMAHVFPPAPVPADCMLPVRLMAQWLYRVAAPPVQELA